ncbi:MAG: VOC family protein [Solirubrobacteraceae bacterium]|nr:VOC family protein [Patulibacter sp.]
MPADSTHHIGLRVKRIEDAAQFYIDAFDGEWLVKPFLRDGPKAARIMGEPEGVRFRIAHVGVGPGVLELFEFESPQVPFERAAPSTLNLMHFGIQVDDVPASVERVLAAGGHLVWEEIGSVGSKSVMYVSDPDHNVIELMDASISDAIVLIREANPGTTP